MKKLHKCEVLSTTKGVELINKRKFGVAALDKNFGMFMVHVATLSAALAMQVHLFWQTQIGQLLADETSPEIPYEYSNYPDIFSFDYAIELLKNTSMNEHAIQLIDKKQSHYESIYAVGPVELRTLKVYIKTYSKTGLI